MCNFMEHLVVSLLCLAGHLFITYCFYICHKNLIVEIGFKNRNPKIKHNTTNKIMRLFRELTLIDLYKKAKVNRHAVKQYFFCNCILLVSDVIAIILWASMVITNSPIDQIIRWQAGFIIAVVLGLGGVEFFMDARYSPSERKRRGIE